MIHAGSGASGIGIVGIWPRHIYPALVVCLILLVFDRSEHPGLPNMYCPAGRWMEIDGDPRIHYRAVLREFGKITEFIVEAGQDILDIPDILLVFVSNFQFIKKAGLSLPVLVGILASGGFEERRGS